MSINAISVKVFHRLPDASTHSPWDGSNSTNSPVSLKRNMARYGRARHQMWMKCTYYNNTQVREYFNERSCKLPRTREIARSGPRVDLGCNSDEWITYHQSSKTTACSSRRMAAATMRLASKERDHRTLRRFTRDCHRAGVVFTERSSSACGETRNHRADIRTELDVDPRFR